MLAECFCSIMSNVMNKLVKTCQKVVVHSVLFIFAVLSGVTIFIQRHVKYFKKILPKTLENGLLFGFCCWASSHVQVMSTNKGKV